MSPIFNLVKGRFGKVTPLHEAPNRRHPAMAVEPKKKPKLKSIEWPEPEPGPSQKYKDLSESLEIDCFEDLKAPGTIYDWLTNISPEFPMNDKWKSVLECPHLHLLTDFWAVWMNPQFPVGDRWKRVLECPRFDLLADFQSYDPGFHMSERAESTWMGIPQLDQLTDPRWNWAVSYSTVEPYEDEIVD